MKKHICIFVFLLPLFAALVAGLRSVRSELPASPFTLDLWPDGCPTSNGLEGLEQNFDGGSRLITQPFLDIYPAANPCGKAVLCCPGGGYWECWHRHEGSDMAEWFNAQGITLAVLHYRMPNGHTTIPLQDAQRAMALLRQRSDSLHIQRIGVMGFSAGGHLASTVATHWTDCFNRPDFQILIYPVISMDAAITHIGSRDALIGSCPSDSLVRLYSNDLQVCADTPPAFLALSGDDDVVSISNSLRYYQALQTYDVPASLHMYPTGSHGWGFRPSPFHHLWTSALATWLQSLQ